MKIRQIGADERVALSLPIQLYAFQPSPVTDSELGKLRATQRYYEGHVTLVAEEDGVALADVSAVPMRQNVRGSVFAMAGVAGVATLPLARRKGYARALLTELLGQMREAHARRRRQQAGPDVAIVEGEPEVPKGGPQRCP